MKHKRMPLVALAVTLALAAGVGPAWAYFTDSSAATGGVTINVKPSTEIEEKYGERVKHVVVTNSAQASVPVYVRARAYSSVEVQASGASWTPGADGWYLYGGIVEPGGKTDELQVRIEFPIAASDERPDGAVPGDNFNIVVVYESTPVRYDAQGNPYADWSYILDSGN